MLESEQNKIVEAKRQQKSSHNGNIISHNVLRYHNELASKSVTKRDSMQSKNSNSRLSFESRSNFNKSNEVQNSFRCRTDFSIFDEPQKEEVVPVKRSILKMNDRPPKVINYEHNKYKFTGDSSLIQNLTDYKTEMMTPKVHQMMTMRGSEVHNGRNSHLESTKMRAKSLHKFSTQVTPKAQVYNKRHNYSGNSVDLRDQFKSRLNDLKSIINSNRKSVRRAEGSCVSKSSKKSKCKKKRKKKSKAKKLPKAQAGIICLHSKIFNKTSRSRVTVSSDKRSEIYLF